MELVIGNKNYSSWSMRPWVLMREVGIEFAELQIPLRRPDSLARKLEYSPAGKVPILIDGEARIWDSLAIVEHLAEKFPGRDIWPTDASVRAHARSVSAEMHSGFLSLRTRMPLNCRARRPNGGRDPGVLKDIDRICAIWRECRARHASEGKFLFGGFSAADAMFVPVASRLQTYDVGLDGGEAEYAKELLALPAVKEWIGAACDEPWSIASFDQVD